MSVYVSLMDFDVKVLREESRCLVSGGHSFSLLSAPYGLRINITCIIVENHQITHETSQCVSSCFLRMCSFLHYVHRLNKDTISILWSVMFRIKQRAVRGIVFTCLSDLASISTTHMPSRGSCYQQSSLSLLLILLLYVCSGQIPPASMDACLHPDSCIITPP